MSNQPVNLAVRFILELVVLSAFGWWDWQRGAEVLRPGLALGLPLLIAVIWITFAVPEDRHILWNRT